MINRRSLITGLISIVAAPAIVRAGSLMPVKKMDWREAARCANVVYLEYCHLWAYTGDRVIQWSGRSLIDDYNPVSQQGVPLMLCGLPDSPRITMES